MSAEPGDWLDEALRSRPAQAPPSGFTPAVLRNVTPRPPAWSLRALIADHGFRVGLAVAAGGVCSVLEPEVVNLAALAAATVGLTGSTMSAWRSA